MIPLLLGGAARLAAGTAVRGAAAGATRGAIVESVKKTTIDAAKKKAGGLAKSFIKKKITNAKKVSTEKLLPTSKKGGGDSGLVRKKSSAIVKRPTSDLQKISENETDSEKEKQKESEPFNGDELIQELTSIKETLAKIKGALGSNLANTLKNQKNERTLLSKQKASEKEAELEKKPEKKDDGKKLEVPKKKMSLLDMIWNFISNVLIGSLLNFLWKYIPQIIKMFGDISKGMSNIWQVLRLGIITLTTLFPKQIKFLAKLTAKIIGPPAKLIGKLLLKAGSVVGFLFKKAGGIVLNLIKGPLLSLIKKVGGEALEQGVKGVAKGTAKLAGRAVGAAGTAISSSGKLINRLKIFSKIFKRVPIVGALIGIGIDLALGESLGRAAAGAAGAAIGSGVGLALGKGGALAVTLATGGLGILAAPIIIGASAFLGSAVGDWAGKQIYDKVTSGAKAAEKAAPLEKKQGGGRLGGGSRSSRTMPSRNSGVQAKPSIATSKISPEVENTAEDNVLKNKESLKRFTELSSIFAGTPFVGQLLKMGIDIGMGAKVEKTQTDAAAQDLGFTIGRALENDEFTVPGLNKRIIGPLSKNLTEWAKKKIFYEVKNREGLFPSIEKGKEDEGAKKAPGAGKPGDDGEDGGDTGPGPVVTGGSADFWAMAAVASLESSNPQGQADVAQVLYNRLASGKYTGKSIKALVLASGQFQPTREGNSKLWAAISDKQSAIAAVNSNPNGRGRGAKIVEASAAAIQNASLQKNAAQFVGGRTDFSATGQYRPYPGAIGIVTRHGHDIGWFVGPGSIAYGKTNPGPASAPKLGDIAVSTPVPKSGGGGRRPEPPSTASLEGLPKQSRQIVFHWNAADYNSTAGDYHTIFTGDGKKHQKVSYNAKTPGTLYRRDAINLALAANPDKNMWPKEAQLNAMAKETANLAKSWGWSKSSINVRNVAGHGEIGAGKDVGNLTRNISTGRPPSKGPKGSQDNYGPTIWGGDGSRWDLSRLSRSDNIGQGENKFRQKVKENMGGQGGGPGARAVSSGGGSNTNPLKLLATDAKTTYYDPSLGGINASGHKTKEGLPATSTGEGYRPNIFSAAAFPPMIAKLPSGNLANAPDFPGGKTLKKPLNLVVTSSKGKQAVVRVNDVGPGVKGHSSNHMLDFSVAAKNFLGTGKGFKIEGPTSNKPGPLSGSATPADLGPTGSTSSSESVSPSSTDTPAADSTVQDSDYDYIIRGAPEMDSTIESIKQSPSYDQSNKKNLDSTIESIKQSPSYDQGNKTNIVMMPIPQVSSGQQANQSGSVGRSMPMFSGGLNSKQVFSHSVRQVLASAFYKI